MSIRYFDFGMDFNIDPPKRPDLKPLCPECDVVLSNGPYLCEHGVTPAPEVEVSVTYAIGDRTLYYRLLGGSE